MTESTFSPNSPATLRTLEARLALALKPANGESKITPGLARMGRCARRRGLPLVFALDIDEKTADKNKAQLNPFSDDYFKNLSIENSSRSTNSVYLFFVDEEKHTISDQLALTDRPVRTAEEHGVFAEQFLAPPRSFNTDPAEVIDRVNGEGILVRYNKALNLIGLLNLHTGVVITFFRPGFDKGGPYAATLKPRAQGEDVFKNYATKQIKKKTNDT